MPASAYSARTPQRWAAPPSPVGGRNTTERHEQRHRAMLRTGIHGMYLLALLAGCAPPLPQRSPVGRLHRSYADSTRTDWDGRGPRPLEATIWYPAAAGSREVAWEIGIFRFGHGAPDAPFADAVRHPIVLLSHGTGGSAAQLSWLAERLVMSGFVVAAVNHHGNTATEPRYRPQGFVLPWERARDLSVLLDRITDDPTVGPHVDTTRVGAAGFSLGGYTALAMAGARLTFSDWQRKRAAEPDAPWSTLPPEAPFTLADVDSLARLDAPFRASVARSEQPTRDVRVQAVFAIAPALVPVLDAASLQSIRVPVRVVLGGEDAQVSPEPTREVLGRLVPEASIELLLGVAHYTFLATCTWRGRVFARALCRDGRTKRTDVHAAVASDAARFFGGHLPARSGDRSSEGQPNYSIPRTALRAAADAER